MSGTRTSDRFSTGEFTALLDEDSTGHRLAEFLLKKNGVPTRPRRVFGNYQPKRYSYDIRTEPVRRSTSEETPQDEAEKESQPVEDPNQIETNHRTGDAIQIKVEPEEEVQDAAALPEQPDPVADVDASAAALHEVQHKAADLEPVPADKSPPKTAVPSQPTAPVLSPPTKSPSSHFAGLRRSGGPIPTSDRLLRISLKRLSSANRRRSLLNEFEHTPSESDFRPPMFSTPFTPSCASKKQAEDPAIGSPSVLKDQFNTEDVFSSLLKHDDALRKALASPSRSSSRKSTDGKESYLHKTPPSSPQLTSAHLNNLADEKERRLHKTPPRSPQLTSAHLNNLADEEERRLRKTPPSSPQLTSAQLNSLADEKERRLHKTPPSSAQLNNLKDGKERRLQNMLPSSPRPTSAQLNNCAQLTTPTSAQLKNCTQPTTPTSANRRRTYTIRKGAQTDEIIRTPTKSQQEQPRQTMADPAYERPSSPVEEAVYALHTTPCKQMPSVPETPVKALVASPKIMKALQKLVGNTSSTVTSAAKEIVRRPSRIPRLTPGKFKSKIDLIMEVPSTPEKVHSRNLAEIPEDQEFAALAEEDVEIPETQAMTAQTDEVMDAVRDPKPVIPQVVISQTSDKYPALEVPNHTLPEIPEAQDIVVLDDTDNTTLQTEGGPNAVRESHPVIQDVVKLHNQTFDKFLPRQKTGLTSADRELNQDTVTHSTAENRATASSHTSTSELTTVINRTKGNAAENIQREKLPPTSHSRSSSPLRMADEDDIRLSDFLTDDEVMTTTRRCSPPVKRVTRMNGRSAPINLAASKSSEPKHANTTRTRRFRKRSSTRRQSQNGRIDSPIPSTETEAEVGPPRAHAAVPTRSGARLRRKITLNAAPRTPINGERFAAEMKAHLARLKNHEILDLRKRNSLGEVIAISGRRRSKLGVIDSLEKRLQLEEEIQFEMLKRNMEGDGNPSLATDEPKMKSQSEQAKEPEQLPEEHPVAQQLLVEHTVVESHAVPEEQIRAEQTQAEEQVVEQPAVERSQSEQLAEDWLFEIPPAPEGFRDEVEQSVGKALQPPDPPDAALDPEHNFCNSSLIDDRSCDQVSFVRKTRSSTVENKSNRKRSRRSKKKDTPELLQKYLAIQNQLGKNKSYINKTKRSLYSQDVEIDHLDETAANTFNSEAEQTNKNTRRISSASHRPKDNSSKSLPDHVVEDNRGIAAAAVNAPSMAGSSAVSESEDVFKKPGLPAPKARPKKKADSSRAQTAVGGRTRIAGKQAAAAAENVQSTTTSGNEVIADANETDNGDGETTATLRRSKRGPKPLKNYWSFRTTDPTPLYDFTLLYRRREMEKQMRLNRTKSSITSTTTFPAASSTVLSNNSNNNNNTKSPRKRGRPRNSKTAEFLGNTNASSGSSAVSRAAREVRPPSLLTVIAESDDSSPSVNDYYSLSESEPARSDNSKKNLRKRGRKPKNNAKTKPKGDNDADSVSSGVSSEVAVATHRRRLSVVQESDSRESEAPTPDENMFNPMDEVNISITQTHKVLRTTRSNNAFTQKPTVSEVTNTEGSSPTKKKKPQKAVKAKKKEAKKKEAKKKEAEEKEIEGKVGKSNPKTTSDATARVRRKKSPPVAVETQRELFPPAESEAPSEDFGVIAVNKSTAVHINKIMNQLSCATKNLRVRLPKLKDSQIAQAKSSLAGLYSSGNAVNANKTPTAGGSDPGNLSEASSAYSDAHTDIPTWLRDISYVGSRILKNSDPEKKLFEEMHCSNPGQLVLTEVDGLEYAFYDNDNQVPFGYLRFKPKQFKRTKVARTFHLTFFVLSGSFRICTNKDEANFSEGAVITIKIGSRYSIENLTDKMSILMVFKKK